MCVYTYIVYIHTCTYTEKQPGGTRQRSHRPSCGLANMNSLVADTQATDVKPLPATWRHGNATSNTARKNAGGAPQDYLGLHEHKIRREERQAGNHQERARCRRCLQGSSTTCLADLTDTLQEQEKPELALTRRGEKISADHRFESPFELEGETFTLVTTRKEHRAAEKNEIISEHSSRGE